MLNCFYHGNRKGCISFNISKYNWIHIHLKCKIRHQNQFLCYRKANKSDKIFNVVAMFVYLRWKLSHGHLDMAPYELNIRRENPAVCQDSCIFNNRYVMTQQQKLRHKYIRFYTEGSLQIRKIYIEQCQKADDEAVRNHW